MDGGLARRKATTYKQDNTENKLTQTSLLQMGFEHTVPAFERAKTVHALNRSATVIGACIS
jgi:hypothetical protein